MFDQGNIQVWRITLNTTMHKIVQLSWDLICVVKRPHKCFQIYDRSKDVKLPGIQTI